MRSSSSGQRLGDGELAAAARCRRSCLTAGALAGVLPPPSWRRFLLPLRRSTRPRRGASAPAWRASAASGSSFFSSRRAASSSACWRASSSAALRASSSALRFSAAARSRLSRSSSIGAARGIFLGALARFASATRASARARGRGVPFPRRSAGAAPRRRAAQHRAARLRARVSQRRLPSWSWPARVFGRGLFGRAWRSSTRVRFFSTTTALVRPWLKLCLTVEVSVFFSDRVLPARPARVSVVGIAHAFLSFRAGLEPAGAIRAGAKPSSRPASNDQPFRQAARV